MKTCRNLLAAAVVAVSVTGCIPPLTTLKVATTAPDAPQSAAITINAGEQAVLSYTGQTLMAYGNGAAFIDPRDYKITPSDAYASPIVIAENCGSGLSSDWPCLKAKRSGNFTINPYVTATYTLTASETVAAILPPADKATFSAVPVTVKVTVNQDVAIADVIGYVTDTRLKACINALGLTRVNEVTNLSCVGVGFGPFVSSLAGLEYFYALQSLDVSNNLLGLDTTPHALAPRYIANPQVINLFKSGLSCVNQKAIETALKAKNPSVVVTKGTSNSNLCP